MKKFFLLIAVLSSYVSLEAQQSNDSFIRGADVSFTPQIETLGGKYFLNGVEKDALDILKENGVNYIRLRIWNSPTGGWCGLGQTLAYAQRVKTKGLKFLLDFHYSDWWADPGKQNKPAAWASASYTALKESVYTYTKYVIERLKNQNTLPDMVQIGNEITPGMLWPDGRISVGGWTQFGELVKEGIRGAKDGALDSTMKIMIHIDRGGDNGTARWFYDNLIAQGVQFDVIGLSYYPWWHGTLTAMKNNVNDLAARYGKEIVLAETAYPWTTQSASDGQGNIYVDPTKLVPGYSSSSQGQKSFLATITKTLKQTPNSKGIGFFYWEPTYIPSTSIGSSWEHLAMFDFTGNASTSLTAFMNLESLKTVNVKLRVNTSTVWDTLKATGVVQLRGEIKGLGSGLLPNGDLVTWDSYSTIKPVNIGGDYWEYQFKMYQHDLLEYKFWTGHSMTSPTKLRIGNEGPVTPSDSSNRNIRKIVAGENDTTIDVQYYNSSGEYVYQFWSPIKHKDDTIGVLFRVSVSDLVKAGSFDPALHGPVVIRGDSALSGGVLSWTTNNVILQRETLSIANGSLWSSVGYFPKNNISAGSPIKYSFYIENSSFGGWESSLENRTFSFPLNDTTLAWKFFNERNPVTSIENHPDILPSEFKLFQNYPNPFNPSTTINFALQAASFTSLKVFDMLGREVATLVGEFKSPGIHSVRFEAGYLPSGIYFYTLTAGTFSDTKKLLLMK